MRSYSYSILFILFIYGCMSDDGPRKYDFKLLRGEVTNLHFQNNIVQNDSFNVLNYMYFFNGGGIGSADFNNDGLLDLFFTANQGPNKLFLNEGKMKFKDVTDFTGIVNNPSIPKWSTGVSVIDINNDGLQDIYINNIGDHLNVKGSNQLYVCSGLVNGVPKYIEEAEKYGLNLVGFSTQTAFFDYDLDGDLDAYQLNHSLHQNGTFGPRKTFQGKQHPLSGDKLLRNNVINKIGKSSIKFEEVTIEAGISSTVIGYGLGIVTGDVNNDGWPDIYVGNDFHENDYLYINQKNGTFKEVMSSRMRHTSRFSMGVDIADINNDGWSEIMSLDMMPEDNEILRSSLGEDGFAVYQFKLGYGYKDQFARNNLQLNNADACAENDYVPSFSEIGLYAGIYATDWSWATLMTDFDNDGYNDIFISNGIPRRMNNIDYTNYMNGEEGYTKALPKNKLDVVEKMPKIKLRNKFFRNKKNLQFQDMQMQIENDQTSYSNGTVRGDFDNDGDIDIVVNNIEDEPFVYENLQVESKTNRSLTIILKGSKNNINAIGSRIIAVRKDGSISSVEHFPVRGFQSSQCHHPVMGIGDATSIDSIIVLWPDRTYSTFKTVPDTSKIELIWKSGLPLFDYNNLVKKATEVASMHRIADTSLLQLYHKENAFIEFNRELLIPHMASTEGPALAVGDMDGDGLDDVFYGSSKREKSQLHYQTTKGTFVLNTPSIIANDSIYEDIDAEIVDIDNDGDNDLLVAAGGNEYKGKEEACRQRMYINEGSGKFTKYYFDDTYMNASCIAIADIDGDGLKDVFLGARSIPWKYGITPSSALLKNMGKGIFINISAKNKMLIEAGMVRDAQWIDMDKDNDVDLAMAIEWGEIAIFTNHNGTFERQNVSHHKGWWNTLLCEDFDNDGDVDIIGGNMGLNGRFNPTEKSPIRLYVHDFDNNGQIEQILTHVRQGKEVPFATHAEMMKQLPSLKKKYLYAKDFAKADVYTMLGKEKLKKSIVREINHLASTYYENKGQGNFVSHALPDYLQFSTLNAIALLVSKNKQSTLVLTAGNFYECNIEMGRYDSDYGNVLTISKDNKMRSFSLSKLNIDGQVRKIRPIRIKNKVVYIYAMNNGKAILLEQR